MNIIVAVDKNWGIGKDGGLLTHLPQDLKYFKERTMGKVVVMGRKTLESLPKKKALPNRTNIVISSTLKEAEGCIICKDRQELEKELAKYPTEDIFIIGGAKVYTDMIPYCTDFYLTFMDEEFDADKHIPNILANENVEKIWEGESMSENGIDYRFTHYRRKDGKL